MPMRTLNKALKGQIEHMNFMSTMFKKPLIDPDTITDADAQRIFQDIDCGLSPENLHCDGEISRSAAQAKYRNYMSAAKALCDLGFEPVDCYEV